MDSCHVFPRNLNSNLVFLVINIQEVVLFCFVLFVLVIHYSWTLDGYMVGTLYIVLMKILLKTLKKTNLFF